VETHSGLQTVKIVVFAYFNAMQRLYFEKIKKIIACLVPQ